MDIDLEIYKVHKGSNGIAISIFSDEKLFHLSYHNNTLELTTLYDVDDFERDIGIRSFRVKDRANTLLYSQNNYHIVYESKNE